MIENIKVDQFGLGYGFVSLMIVWNESVTNRLRTKVHSKLFYERFNVEVLNYHYAKYYPLVKIS